MKKRTFFRHVLCDLRGACGAAWPGRARPSGRCRSGQLRRPGGDGADAATGDASGFCSALVLNSRIVLTAAHCLRPLNDMAVNYRDASGTPILIPVEAALAHPLYRPNAIRERVMSIGVALILQAARPLDPRFVGASLAMGEVPAVGEQIILSGYGAAREGDWSSSGTLRSVTLAVRDPASKVLIWAADPTGAEAGACSGDAGAPIWSADGRTAVAIVTWGQALNGRGCGGLTQGPWLAPLRDWIEETERSLGGPAPAPAPAATPAPVVASAPPPAYAPAPATGNNIPLVKPREAPVGQAVGASGRTVVAMVPDGGTFKVPVTINGQLTLKFVVDSGAADVSIPADVVATLLRTETITDADFLDKQTYRLADGSTVPSQRFVIRTLKIGDKTLENVIGSIAPVTGSLLLGQSFLSRFKSWSMDNQRQALMLN